MEDLNKFIPRCRKCDRGIQGIPGATLEITEDGVDSHVLFWHKQCVPKEIRVKALQVVRVTDR